MSHVRCWAIPLVASLAGCLDLPPLLFATDHLFVGSDAPETLCEGTLARWEGQEQLVERALGLEVKSPIFMYVFVWAPGELCDFDEPGGGCYDRAREEVYTTMSAATHEIVHAVTAELGRGDAFFEEGLAVDLTGAGLRFATTDPSSNLGLDVEDVSLHTAGHFMRWLRLTYGPAVIRELLERSSAHREPAHARRVFEDVLGRSFAALEHEYTTHAPEFFAFFEAIPPPVVPLAPEGLQTTLELDCASTETEGFGGRLWRRLLVDVAAPGPYVLEVVNVSPPAPTSPDPADEPSIRPTVTAMLTLRRSQDWPPGAAIPEPAIAPIGDDWFAHGERIEAGIATDIRLDRARYQLELETTGPDPVRVEVSLWPKIGPTPIRP